MENIYVYSPFDVVSQYIDTHVYYFTRPEFMTIMKTKKNIWTNNPLPIPILYLISSRIEAEIVSDLPKPAPLRTLLRKVEKGIIYLHKIF